MKFIAEIDVMPLKEILDPQGKAVKLGLNHLDIQNIKEVRVGKHIQIELEAENEAMAKEKVETACQKLLCNALIESYVFTLTEVNEKLKR